MHWVWHVAPIERGLVAAVSVSPTICDHPHFTDEGLKAPTCALHLLSYLSLKLGVKPLIRHEREREFECPSCRQVTLNVSQAAEISYNVGIMSRNTGTVDGGKDLKEKRTGAKDRGRKGSWRTVRGKNKKDWLHHIAWVWPSSR